jgi:hypothetical protein
MSSLYRKHYAPQRNPLANAVAYAGIATKLGVSPMRSGLVRRLRTGSARPEAPAVAENRS